MSDLVCRGLDGGNSLHALAAFGLLRLGHRLHPGLRLGWRLVDGAWRPVVAPVPDAEGFCAELARTLVVLAAVGAPDPALNRQVGRCSADGKRLDKAIKEAQQQAKAAAKAGKLDRTASQAAIEAATAELRTQREAVQRDLVQAQEALATANGSGIAHLGDIIAVDPAIHRRMGQAAVKAWLTEVQPGDPGTGDAALIVAQLPALACDQMAEGGRLTPTPFSFSNGSSGQCLLKDFKGCAGAVTTALMRAALLAQGERVVIGRTGLNWDPADCREYALRWNNPADGKLSPKATDVAANALAYLGLSLLPCVPMGDRLDAVGWGPGKAFTWPIWDGDLGIDAVAALLAHPDLVVAPDTGGRLRVCGIRQVNRALVINPNGKRNFFAPASPVA